VSCLYLRREGYPAPVCVPMHERNIHKGTLNAIRCRQIQAPRGRRPSSLV